jgi:hypothetical protein
MPETIHKPVKGTTMKTATSRRSEATDLAKVKHAWERTTAQLAEVRTHLAHWELAVAEKTADGEDATEALAELQRAESAVKQFESAVAILWQRNEAAQTAQIERERQEQIEKEVEVVQHAKQVSLKVDQRLLDLEHLIADELAPALNAMRDILIRSGIREGELHFQSEIPGLIKQLVDLVFFPILKQGYIPPNNRKYSCFSAVIPDEDWTRSRPRPGPTMARPIPGWQAEG